MRNLIFTLFVLSLATLASAQTTIYSEDFSSTPDDKGAVDGTAPGDIDLTGVDWTIDVSACNLGNGDYFATNNNRFEAEDTDGDAYWFSPSISIDNYKTINLSIDVSENGYTSNDNIEVYYSLDGATPVSFGYASNGFNNNTFTTSIFNCDQYASLQIQVRIYCNGGNDIGRFDNILVTGVEKPADPASTFVNNITTTTANAHWTLTPGSDNVLVVAKQGTVDFVPTDGQTYSANATFGSQHLGNSNYAVYYGTADSVLISGLTAATGYELTYFSHNSTTGVYSCGTSETFNTDCATPNNATNFTLTPNYGSVALSWLNTACFDEVLVVAKEGSAVTATPSSTGYNLYNFNSSFGAGTDIGTSEFIVFKGTASNVTVTNLSSANTYHFKVFTRKGNNWSSGIAVSGSPTNSLLIYNETFTGQDGQGYDGNTLTNDAVCWNMSRSGNISDYVKVVNGQLEATNVRADVTWESEVIDISQFNNVQLNCDLIANVNWAGGDYFVLEYSINSGAFQEVVNLTSGFTSGTITENNINGNTIQIRITIYNSWNSDTFFVDNIQLQGTITCTPPVIGATNIGASQITANTAVIGWNLNDANEVLAVLREDGTPQYKPFIGQDYNPDVDYTTGEQICIGNYTIYKGANTSSNIVGLAPESTYHVDLYGYNTPNYCYNLNPITVTFTTDCNSPSNATNLTATPGNSAVTLNWNVPSCFDEFLVVAKSGGTPAFTPSGDTTFTTNTDFGTAGTLVFPSEYAVYQANGTTTTITGLTPGQQYTFKVYTKKAGSWTAGITVSAIPTSGGFELVTSGVGHTINFDNTVSNVNNGAYSGSGVSTSPATGELDADSWAFTGERNGAVSQFGTGSTNGRYGRGTRNTPSQGSKNSGGLYAYNVNNGVGAANYTLGMQSDNNDFVPGTATLMIANTTGAVVKSLKVDYVVYEYNNQSNSVDVTFSHSASNSNFSNLSDADYASTAGANSNSWVPTNKSITISGLSIPEGGLYYLRWTVNSSVSNNNSDGIAIDDITITPNPKNIWNGTAWSNGNPSADEDAEIIGDYYTSSEGSFACNNLIVNSGVVVDIANNRSITVSGVLTNNGTIQVAKFGGLIQTEGSTVHGTGTYSVSKQGHNPSATNRWNYVSAPVADVNKTVLNSNYVYAYNPANAIANDNSGYGWQFAGSANLTPGASYAVINPGSIVMSGSQVNNGDVVVPFNKDEYTTGSKVFNLIGNPYPSGLDLDLLLAENSFLEPTFYFWCDDASGGTGFASNDYGVYNAATGIGVSVNGFSVIDNTIGTCQGFFAVAKTSETTGTTNLTFKNSMRTDNVNRYFRPQNLPAAWVSLSLDTAYYSQTAVGFSPLATNKIDQDLEAEKRSTDNISIHSVVQDQRFSITTMADLIHGNQGVDIELVTKDAGTYTITVDSLRNLEGTMVYLMDYSNNSLTPIVNNTVELELNANTTYTNRFALIFKQQTTSVANANEETSAYTIYNTTEAFEIQSFDFNEKNVRVVNMNGQTVWQNTLAASTISIPKNELGAAGTYVIIIEAEQTFEVLKVVR